MLKVGLIGCGGIGNVHAKSWMYLSNIVTLVAVADSDTEKAARVAAECGAVMYKDALEMLQKEKLDVVDICLPTFLHADFCIMAMKYVKNIIIEKPICLKEEEIQRLLEAEKKSGALINVAHIGRYAIPYRYLKEVFDTNKYGKLLSATFLRISPKPVWVKDYDNVEKTGGMAVDLHIHDVDYIRHLMGGEPDKVSSTVRRNAEGSVQHIWSAYHYGEAILTAECSWAYPVSMPFAKTYRVMFEKATVVLDEQGVVTVYPEEGEAFEPQLEEEIRMDLGINVTTFGTFVRELRCFAESIVNGENRAVIPLSDAIAALRLVKKELTEGVNYADCNV